MWDRERTIRCSYLTVPLLSVICLFWLVSCQPLATSFEETEEAVSLTARIVSPPPDTFTVAKVMTWNIRFGAGRLPWFGDACGERVLFTEAEILRSLQGIVAKINEVKPDILLLQEVDMGSKRSAYVDELRWIMDRTNFNYAVYGSQWKSQFIPSDGLGRMDEANAILSRWKIDGAERIQLSLRGDQDAATRYFYERCCIVKGRIKVPGVNDLVAVNIHASAFATDNTKKDHLVRLKTELDRIRADGRLFVAGGDFNTLPPGSDSTDYCMEDMCPGESFHHSNDRPVHKEGSDYTPEKEWLSDLYDSYSCAVPLALYRADQSRYFTHTTRPRHFWDRTLDYLFTNYRWAENSSVTHQDALTQSDHAPVSSVLILPK